MLMEKRNAVARFYRAANRQICPECGSPMEMIDRRQESGTLFIWYRCMRIGCDGDWLKTINDYHKGIKKVV